MVKETFDWTRCIFGLILLGMGAPILWLYMQWMKAILDTLFPDK